MRLGSIRRSRLLAAFLLAASPAAGGTVLPALHPCPVDAPWLAARGGDGEHAHHDGHGQPGPERHPGCQCIGGCLAGALEAAPPEALIRAWVAVPVVREPTADRSPVPAASRRPWQQPPSTAPPLA